MNRDTYERGTRAAQGIMSAATPGLLVDGKWGKYTQKVYESLTGQLRDQVDAVLKALGTRAADLAAFRRQELEMADAITVPAAVNSEEWVPEPEMRVIIRKAALAAGVDADMLWLFLNLEAPSRTVSGVKQYKRTAVNSLGYSGLFQFDRKGEAWSVAARFVRGLAPFEQGKFDAYQSALAAAGYIKANTVTIRNLGYKGPITANIAYLMHNQGAKGAYDILTGKKVLAGTQSKAAIAVASAARREYRA